MAFEKCDRYIYKRHVCVNECEKAPRHAMSLVVVNLGIVGTILYLFLFFSSHSLSSSLLCYQRRINVVCARDNKYVL